MKPFHDPDESIGSLDATTAATLVATSADVALVLDRDGVIQDMSVQTSDLSMELEGFGRWLGRPWSDTVSADSQRKVETLLREADTRPASTWRQLTHQTIAGRDLPILYSAVKLGSNGHIVALGRDLRTVAALQQRLVDAQMSMERDYAKLRFAETRYRLLFQTANEPVLIVDAATQKIVEGNPAATALTEERGGRMIGRPFVELFAATARTKVQAMIVELRGASRSEETTAVLEGGRPVGVHAAVYRQEGATMILARLLPVASTPAAGAETAEPDHRMLDFLRISPDAFVLADSSGTVLSANPSFAAMIQVEDADALRGQPLEKWFGRAGVDLDVVLANLRQHGIVRLYATTLRGEAGATIDIEASAVALGRGKAASFGFAIRDVGRRVTPQTRSRELPRSADQLTDMIGRVPLKEMVRETTDVIEKLCIEAALELTGDNRASAAEVLGLSRQSLYVKLRRYGLAEPGVEEDA